jgi:hypothetical protein
MDGHVRHDTTHTCVRVQHCPKIRKCADIFDCLPPTTVYACHHLESHTTDFECPESDGTFAASDDHICARQYFECHDDLATARTCAEAGYVFDPAVGACLPALSARGCRSLGTHASSAATTRFTGSSPIATARPLANPTHNGLVQAFLPNSRPHSSTSPYSPHMSGERTSV